MHRLFVAIRLPRQIRCRLLAVMGGIRGARWQTDEQLHLTLRFIGEVDHHQADDILAALGAIHQPPFALALNGLGIFERRGEPVTLWAGVTPHEPLKALHKKVDQACLRVGIQPDRRAYLPHVTLARLGRDAGPVRHLLEEAGGAAGDPFAVEEFCLFESQLTPQGPIYSIVERYSLG